jgi:hypothetical protein
VQKGTLFPDHVIDFHQMFIIDPWDHHRIHLAQNIRLLQGL